MKFSAMLCASVAVMAVVGAPAEGAFAATMLKTNWSYKFASTDTVAATDCTSKGGVVSTGTDGNKVCTMSAASVSYIFAAADTVAANDCTAKGGIVSTAADGNNVCTKLAATPAPTTGREPNN